MVLNFSNKCCSFLHGLLTTAREIAWHVTDVIRAIDAQLSTWDEDTFLKALPQLRLAFTELTPRELSRVAEHVAIYHGEVNLGNLIEAELYEHEVRLGLELTQLVRETLHADGLAQ